MADIIRLSDHRRPSKYLRDYTPCEYDEARRRLQQSNDEQDRKLNALLDLCEGKPLPTEYEI